MIRALPFALLLVAFDVQAQQSQPACGPRSEVVGTLERKYHEVPVASGMMPTGLLMEILASPEGTWTIIVTHPQGRSCVFSAGDGWSADAPKDAGRSL